MREKVKVLQPLLRPHGDYNSIRLPYKYIAQASGVPEWLLHYSRPGKPLAERKVKPDMSIEALRAMPEFQ